MSFAVLFFFPHFREVSGQNLADGRLPDLQGSAQSVSKAFLFKTASSSPGIIYLSQVPYTGFGRTGRVVAFFSIVALWSLVLVLIARSDEIRGFFKTKFKSLEKPSNGERSSGGYIFSVNDKKILTMDMNPVNETSTDVLVPKYDANFKKEKSLAEIAETYVPTPRDYGIVTKEAVLADNKKEKNMKPDLMTDVNSFVNLIVRGEEKPVLEYVRKLKEKNVPVEDFMSSVILELDSAYRAKIEGETNRRNVVLSQIVSHWSAAKLEAVLAALFSIIDKNYSNQHVGLRIALMRMSKSE